MANSSGDAASQARKTLLAHLQAKRAQLDEAIAALEKLGDLSEMDPERHVAEVSADASDVVPGMFGGLTISDAIKQLLLIKRRPLKNAEIIEGLAAGGHKLAASSPDVAAAVSTALHRRAQATKDIVKLGRGLWGLSKSGFKGPR